jgi:hypothetical protein
MVNQCAEMIFYLLISILLVLVIKKSYIFVGYFWADLTGR